MRSAIALLSIAAAASALETPPISEKPVTGLCDVSKNYAGYVSIDPSTSKELFYWYFESLSSPSTDPVMLWMTGGPGCSSMLALASENGPCFANKDGKTMSPNKYAWNNKANVIWVDQPANTGFSHSTESGEDTNEKQVSDDMYKLLQGFLKLHPELQGRPWLITGESYGGHYVPAVSARIFEGNQDSSNIYMPLKGIAIGNGLTDPLIQYQYYATDAYNYTKEVLGKPVISLESYSQMVGAWPHCQSLIAQCQKDTSACNEAREFCNNAMLTPYENTGLNPYDFTKECGPYPLCYDFTFITNFFNDDATQQALGVSRQWQTCNFEVNAVLAKNDWAKDYQQDLLGPLNNGTNVLIYAGDYDFICNWVGNDAWPQQLGYKPWSPVPQFANYTPPGVSEPIGSMRKAGNLAFLKAWKGGHMYPADQPANALAMINHLIDGWN